MAERRKIIFQIGAEDTASRVLGSLQGGLQRFGDSIRNAFNIDLVSRFNSALVRLGQEFQQAVKRGVEFNSTLEDARLGIAAALKQFNPERFNDFTAALAEAGNALELLKKRAIESPATLKELVASFQAISGAALSAGMSVQQTVDLTVLMSQALAGMGIRSEQIVQESRALITGNITEDAFAAKQLKITRADIMNAREQGRVFEFLSERMSAFGEAGKLAAGNFTVLRSTLQDLFDKLSGEFAKPLFEQLKKSLEELSKVLSRPGFMEDFNMFAEALAKVVQFATKIAAFSAQWLGPLVQWVKDRWEDGVAFIQKALFKMTETVMEQTIKMATHLNSVPLVPDIDLGPMQQDLEEARMALAMLEEEAKKREESRQSRHLFTALGFAGAADESNAGGGNAGNKPTLIPEVSDAAIKMIQEVDAEFARSSRNRLEIAAQEYFSRLSLLQTEVEDVEQFAVTKRQLDETYERVKTEIAKEGAEKRLRTLLEQVTQLDGTYRRSLEETNRLFEIGSITQSEAIRRSNDAVLEYQSSLEKLLLVFQALAAANPDLPEAREEIARIKDALLELKGAFQDQSFIGTLKRNLRELADEWGALARNAANLITNSLGRAVDGVSNSIMGMIDGTQTWGQAFANVARSIIADLIRVVVQWVAQMTIVRALRKVMDAEQVASAATRTTAETPAMIAASIGSFGAAAAIGIAALLAGIAVGMAAFASGGLVTGAGGPREDRVMIRASDGEYVMSAAAVEHYGLGFMEAVNARAIGASGAAAGAGGGSVTVSPAPVNVAVINNKAALREYLRSNEGRQVLVDEMTAQKMELGLEG